MNDDQIDNSVEVTSATLTRRRVLTLLGVGPASELLVWLGFGGKPLAPNEVSVYQVGSCSGVDCPPWCECINGVCQPAPVQINAVRLRTRDGRYLQAENGGGRLNTLIASNVAIPQTWETFLFISPPTVWPLTSGDSISLAVCGHDWSSSNYRIRVDAVLISHPPLVGWQYGGPDCYLRVTDGCLSRPCDAGHSDEWTFFLEKAGGGQINTGDEVTIRTVDDYYLRTEAPQNRARVLADAMPGQEGIVPEVFIVDFNQVKAGLGWRPSSVQCQTCGTVTGIVSNANTGQLIQDARVTAQGINFTSVTGADGKFMLSSGSETCMPAGTWTLATSANFYQTKRNDIIVTAGGTTDVRIQLAGTEVRGIVKSCSTSGSPVPDIDVFQVDPNNGNNPLTRPDRTLIYNRTDSDGMFVINHAWHGNWALWADGAAIRLINVPPEGLSNVVLIVNDSECSCGDIIGTVIEADTEPPKPIKGAKVKRVGSNPGEFEAITNDEGKFQIACVRPQGDHVLKTTATGYEPSTDIVSVPGSGSSAPIEIKLRKSSIQPISEIIIELNWGTEPPDLDAHLTGPNDQGGRFHLYYANRMQPPVDFAALDVDDITAQGPEKITVRKSSTGTSAGNFIAGEYHYWVHNYSRSSFANSSAIIKVFQSGMPPRQFTVTNATGNPADDLWHVVNVRIDTSGRIVDLRPIEVFLQGNETTEL